MGRPATQHEERKAKIIGAALEVFAQKGYDGTSNRLIAQAASLNSVALIYHYFPSKTDLFKACLERSTALEDLKRDLITRQDRPIEVYLRQVAMGYLNTLSGKPVNRLFLMVLAAAQSHPELMPILIGKLSEVIFFPLITYFTRQITEGRLRAISPITAAQELLGPLMLRAIAGTLLEASLPFVFPDKEEFIDTHVKAFLDGLRNRPE